jgi:hypothetical protein
VLQSSGLERREGAKVGYVAAQEAAWRVRFSRWGGAGRTKGDGWSLLRQMGWWWGEQRAKVGRT